MFQQFVNQIEPAIVTAAVTVLTAFVGAVGTAAIKFISTKKVAVIKQIGANEYNSKLTLAKQAWGIVDEMFRITPELTKTISAKQEAFAAQIEKMIPGVTADEIEQLRQTVAAEINAGKAALTVTASDTDTSKSADVLQSTAKSVDAPTSVPEDTASNDTPAADSTPSAQTQVEAAPQNITVNVTVPTAATPAEIAQQVTAAVQQAQTSGTVQS